MDRLVSGPAVNQYPHHLALSSSSGPSYSRARLVIDFTSVTSGRQYRLLTRAALVHGSIVPRQVYVCWN